MSLQLQAADTRLNESTTSDDSVQEIYNIQPGSTGPAGQYWQQLKSSKQTIMNYKLLEIKYSSVLKLYAAMSRELRDTQLRLAETQQYKRIQIEQLRERILELESNPPDTIIPNQQFEEDYGAIPSGAITPKFDKSFIYQFGGYVAGVEVSTQTQLQIEQFQKSDDINIKIMVTQPPSEAIPEEAVKVFYFAMTLDKNLLSVKKQNSPTKNGSTPGKQRLNEIIETEECASSIDSGLDSSYASVISDSYEDLEGHIYTPNTENRLYTFGKSIAKVNNFFTLNDPNEQIIPEMSESGDEFNSSFECSVHNNREEPNEFQHNLRVLNKELDRGSSCHAEHTSDKNSPENSPSLSPRKSRKRSEMLKIAIPLIPKNIEFSQELPTGTARSAPRIVRQGSDEPQSARLSFRRTPQQKEQSRLEYFEVQKLIKMQSAKNQQRRSTKEQGLDIIAQQFRVHDQNRRIMDHPYILGIISAMLLLMIFLLPM